MDPPEARVTTVPEGEAGLGVGLGVGAGVGEPEEGVRIRTTTSSGTDIVKLWVAPVEEAPVRGLYPPRIKYKTRIVFCNCLKIQLPRWDGVSNSDWDTNRIVWDVIISVVCFVYWHILPNSNIEDSAWFL
jgi:hypothetical protein